jgi:nucleotide-binding universal stress UspA family protein
VTHIVVGVDGSKESRAALSWAFEHARGAGADLEVVLAYDTGVAWIDVGSEYEEPMKREAATRAQRELDAILAEENPDDSVALSSRTVAGAPADVLVEAARAADLLVVGSRGRGGFAGLLLGSVSQRCVERAPCPVVVVPGRL